MLPFNNWFLQTFLLINVFYCDFAVQFQIIIQREFSCSTQYLVNKPWAAFDVKHSNIKQFVVTDLYVALYFSNFLARLLYKYLARLNEESSYTLKHFKWILLVKRN